MKKAILPGIASLLLLSLFPSCSKTGNSGTNPNLIHIVKGYKIFDVKGSPAGLVGSPEDQLALGDYHGVLYEINYYPNPAISKINLHLNNHLDPSSVKHIRLLPAKSDGKIPDPFPSLFTGASAVTPVLDITTQERNLTLSLDSFPKGYYHLEVYFGTQKLYGDILSTDENHL